MPDIFETFPESPDLTQEIRLALKKEGIEEVVKSTDTAVVTYAGFELTPSNEDGKIRVEYIPMRVHPETLRHASAAEQQKLRLILRGKYSDVLKAAGFEVEEKVSGITNRAYLLAGRACNEPS